MSNIDLVFKELDKRHPKLVFLNGKTSTGKTTLSNTLRSKYDCAVIELDEVIYGLESPAGMNRFLEAYQKRDHLDYVDNFVAAVKARIGEALKNHSFVIIEGAIVQSETLLEIIDDWKDSFMFIYLDIKNISVYAERLTNRFKLSNENDRNGLPNLFWDKFNPNILTQYYSDREITPTVKDAIYAYATDSIRESEVRLINFSSKFDHILKIEV
ncbi:MAG: hypothetical protein QG593_542 [Patescibacteria group bacterium]|jgi:adenylate kinase family enzyme|nr:hypothetical protein [Patescibacteria group bacterium]MDQ5970025.1 hypothetical protein [Patescibacteria group bacterium]